MKSFLIWTSGSGGDVVKRHFLSSSLVASLLGGGGGKWNPLCNLGNMHHGEYLYEINLNLDQSFRRKCCLKIFLI